MATITRVAVLSCSQRLGQSVRHFVETRLGLRGLWKQPPAVFSPTLSVDAAFTSVSRWLRSAVTAAGPGTLAVIVDPLYSWGGEHHLAEVEALRPLARLSPWSALLGRLVLAFPEVRWIFLSAPSSWARFDPLPATIALTELHQLGTMLSSAVDPLMDPNGLRSRTRERGINAWLADHALPVPVRQRSAAAIDEEPSYAAFTAYAAYRLGFKAFTLTRWRDLQACAGGAGDYRLALTIEDLYLNYPDQPGNLEEQVPVTQQRISFPVDQRRLSNLAFRDYLLPALGNCGHRILLTVGHRRGRALAETWRRNREYVASKRIVFKRVLKPVSGLFRFYRQAGLWSRLQRCPRFEDGFGNLGKRAVGRPDNPQVGGHSAPGPILAIAEVLLSGSRHHLERCESLEDAVAAAVLALDAKELLRNQTPTMALEAVALQHEAEVTAESLFLGVEYNLGLNDRFREIEQEVEAISHWFARSQQRRSSLNARLAIIERLAKRFADLHQIEEELACLAEARRLRFKFWAEQKSWRRPLKPLLDYLSYCLSSLPRFAGVVVAWAIFFGLSYYLFANLALRPSEDLNFWSAMVGAGKLFFTGEPSGRWADLTEYGATPGWETVWEAWLAFQGLISLTNLGLLVSHLYLIVSRR